MARAPRRICFPQAWEDLAEVWIRAARALLHLAGCLGTRHRHSHKRRCHEPRVLGSMFDRGVWLAAWLQEGFCLGYDLRSNRTSSLVAASFQLTHAWLWVKTNGTILGKVTTHFRTYLSGDWDVHWGYDLDFDPWHTCMVAASAFKLKASPS